jgi:hypothetical protein
MRLVVQPVPERALPTRDRLVIRGRVLVRVSLQVLAELHALRNPEVPHVVKPVVSADLLHTIRVIAAVLGSA